MTLRFDKHLQCWIFDCTREESQIPSAAGFTAVYAENRAVRRQFLYWSTANHRVALKLVEYCHDAGDREMLMGEALKGRDPDKVTMAFDGVTYRWYSPVIDAACYRECPQQAGWRFQGARSNDFVTTWPAFWFTESVDDAVLCYRLAVKSLDGEMLIVTEEARVMILKRIQFYKGWSDALGYEPPEIGPKEA